MHLNQTNQIMSCLFPSVWVNQTSSWCIYCVFRAQYTNAHIYMENEHALNTTWQKSIYVLIKCLIIATINLNYPHIESTHLSLRIHNQFILNVLCFAEITPWELGYKFFRDTFLNKSLGQNIFPENEENSLYKTTLG